MTPSPTVLITGATKGIGRAIAERFAPECKVLHLVSRHASDLLELNDVLSRAGLEIHVHEVDLSVALQVQQLVTDVLQISPNIDVLINNAGVYLPGSLLDESSGNLDYMIRLNVLSHYELTKGLVSALKGKGHVFHMASVASRKMFVNKPSYSISKHAQLALTDAFRHELRPLGIRVTTVMPGPTWSASWENVDFPEERLLDPRHIADLMWHAWNLPQEVDLEELVIRPREGDID